LLDELIIESIQPAGGRTSYRLAEADVNHPSDCLIGWRSDRAATRASLVEQGRLPKMSLGMCVRRERFSLPVEAAWMTKL